MQNDHADAVKMKFAEALKACMGQAALENITVKEICTRAGLSRQSFYRHFLDKYDLMNWYFDRLLDLSFQEMGSGKTVYEGLVRKFEYIQEERLFFATGFRNDDQNNLREHDFARIHAFYRNLIHEKSGSYPDPHMDRILEMYCQASVYMTVKWVLGGMEDTPKALASLMIDAMPEKLAALFRKLNILH